MSTLVIVPVDGGELGFQHPCVGLVKVYYYFWIFLFVSAGTWNREVKKLRGRLLHVDKRGSFIVYYLER